MKVTLTYYLEVISSWCHWAEPAWAELKHRYQGRVAFDWKIALMDASGLPVSVAQTEWFYRRSGSLVRSPYMLNPGWFEPDFKEYPAPNLVALAAKEMGVVDDRVRLAIANAAVRDGRKVGRWEVAAEVGAAAGGLEPAVLLARAQSGVIAELAKATTAEFHALQITQRPAFLLDSVIGDRAVFSGFARAEPLAAAIDSMLADAAAYASWKAHFGDPPNTSPG
jgi:predicted DsbA family dithiol-disulfide isomerase